MLELKKLSSGQLALGLCCALGAGCADNFARAPHGRAAGQWSVSLPSNTSLAQGLAYGRGGQSLPEARVSEPAAPAVLAEEAAPAARKRVLHKRSNAAPPAVPEPVRPTQNAPLPAAPVSAPAAPARAPQTELAMAEPEQLARYQEREASSQSQQTFRGGDAIIIGAGTVILVLLVVLLVLLLV